MCPGLLVWIPKNRQILDCFFLTFFNISEIRVDFPGNNNADFNDLAFEWG